MYRVCSLLSFEPDVSAVRIQSVVNGTFINIVPDRFAKEDSSKGDISVKVKTCTGSANAGDLGKGDGMLIIKMASTDAYSVQTLQQSGTSMGGWKPETGTATGFNPVQPNHPAYTVIKELSSLVRKHLKNNTGKFRLTALFFLDMNSVPVVPRYR